MKHTSGRFGGIDESQLTNFSLRPGGGAKPDRPLVELHPPIQRHNLLEDDLHHDEDDDLDHTAEDHLEGTFIDVGGEVYGDPEGRPRGDRAVEEQTGEPPQPDDEKHPHVHAPPPAPQKLPTSCHACHEKIGKGERFLATAMLCAKREEPVSFHEGCFRCVRCAELCDPTRFRPTREGPLCLRCGLPCCGMCKVGCAVEGKRRLEK